MRERAAQRGESGPLYRKLKPGPGRSRDEVLANQCARLCGAMVQLVAEQGYPQVTVRGLARLAGVSTKTFYKCFANVEECFAVTYARIVRGVLPRAPGPAADADEPLGSRVRTLFEDLAQDRRAAHLVLVESFVVGPVVEARARAARRAYERLARDGFAAGPGSVRIPSSAARGIVGAGARVARTRLLADPPEDAVAVAEGFAGWLLALRDERLEKLSRAGSLRELDRSAVAPSRPTIGDDRQYLLTAAAKLSLSDGYANLTVPAIWREAGVTRQSFDENFGDVTECFLAAVDARMERAAERAEQEASAAERWERGVARMVARLCSELARDPALARLGFVEIFAPGRLGFELRESLVTRWARRLYRGAPSSAVKTPSGSTLGARTTRARRSTSTRKIAPPKAEAGNNRRWRGPSSRRITWGIIRPTKPINPLIETAAAVINEARPMISSL